MLTILFWGIRGIFPNVRSRRPEVFAKKSFSEIVFKIHVGTFGKILGLGPQI